MSEDPDTRTSHRAATDQRTEPRGLPTGLVLTIAFGTVLQALNASTMAVAMVDIREAFHAGSATSWLISGLYLATAVGSPTAGRLADLFGPRKVFLVSLAVTAIASAAAPFAPTLGWLIAFRVLLGLGTCAAYPAGVTLLRRQADQQGVALPATALSLLAIGGQIMIALGPVVGGVLVQFWGWPAIFTINLPLVLISAVLALLWLPADDPARRPGGPVLRQLDLGGAALFAAVIAVLMLFLLSLAGQPDWWLLALWTGLLAAFIAYELRVAHPFVDLRVLAGNRPLTGTYLRTAWTYVAFYAVFYGLPMWLETSRGLDPGTVGVVVLPMALAAMTVVAIASRTLRHGHWPVLLVGSAAFVAGGLALMTLHATSPIAALVAVAALLGIPNGVNNIGNQTAMYRQADAAHAGIASGLYRTSQYVGANIAAAVIELCYAGPASDPGLHRIGLVIVGISAVLVVGALVGSARARKQR